MKNNAFLGEQICKDWEKNVSKTGNILDIKIIDFIMIVDDGEGQESVWVQN